MTNDKWKMENETPDFRSHKFSICHLSSVICHLPFVRVSSRTLFLDKHCRAAQAGSRLRLRSLEGLSNAIGSRARDGSGNG